MSYTRTAKYQPGGRFCGSSCKSGYLEDMKHGLCYGPHALQDEDGKVMYVSRRVFCADQDICVYCSADLTKQKGCVR